MGWGTDRWIVRQLAHRSDQAYTCIYIYSLSDKPRLPLEVAYIHIETEQNRT